MLCTDIQVPAGRPEWAFVRAWNQLISHRLRYTASFARIVCETEDPLLRYRATEMAELLAEGQKLVEYDHELALKILDHIEVTAEGKLCVIFLAGTKITV